MLHHSYKWEPWTKAQTLPVQVQCGTEGGNSEKGYSNLDISSFNSLLFILNTEIHRNPTDFSFLNAMPCLTKDFFQKTQNQLILISQNIEVWDPSSAFENV